MLIIKLWNYFRGYIYFTLEGLNLERIINLAIDRNVYLWDIKRIDYTTIEAKVGVNGYREILEILEKTGCKGKINMRIGWPFFISKFKNRKMILVGFCISIILIISITSFIWTIDINCSNYLLERDVMKFLNNSGISSGILKYKVDESKIKNSLLIQYDKIAWVGLNIKGTRLTIDLIEKNNQASKLDSTTPTNIVSTKTGIIEKIIARDGDALVKKGDVVKPNQVLISGTIERNDTVLRYVHSMGTVYARIYYEKEFKASTEKVLREETGLKHTRRILKLGNTSITMGSSNIPFKKYILNTENKSLNIWRNIRIPVEFVIEEYFEISEKKIEISEEDLKKSLRDRLMVSLVSEMPKESKITNKTFAFSRDGNYIVGKLIIEAVESIGKERAILVPEDANNEE